MVLAAWWKLGCGADPYADEFRRFAENVPVVTYAINNKTADVFAQKVSLSIWETELFIATPIGDINIITPLIGRNNAYNVLAAVATGLSINIPLQVSSGCHSICFLCLGDTVTVVKERYLVSERGRLVILQAVRSCILVCSDS